MSAMGGKRTSHSGHGKSGSPRLQDGGTGAEEIVLSSARGTTRPEVLTSAATWLAIGVNLFNLLVEPLGKWPWLQVFLTTVTKG